MSTPLSPLAAQLGRLDRVRAARRQREPMSDAHITLSHGSGGKASHHLIDGLIVPALGAAAGTLNEDSAVVAVAGLASGRLAFTTDSYVVSPLFFPGGDIGSLAVHGTINDLAMAGAQPLFLSLAFILEEGLKTDVLRAVVRSIGEAASAACVTIATGDTKVVPRGKADQMFVTTTGVGLVAEGRSLSAMNLRAGDQVLLSGFIGDHGIAVMLAREALEIEADIRSDSAPLHRMVADVLAAAPSTRALKDPTRGGVATTLNELARHAGVAIAIDERRVPVRADVRAACEMLGLDPLHIANEGKLIAVVPAAEADAALQAMRAACHGSAAAIIGEVLDGPQDLVLLKTEAGGSRVLDMLVGDPLPWIC
jgi:hydrogenase expression/formation protein HypE